MHSTPCRDKKIADKGPAAFKTTVRPGITSPARELSLRPMAPPGPAYGDSSARAAPEQARSRFLPPGLAAQARGSREQRRLSPPQ